MTTLKGKIDTAKFLIPYYLYMGETLIKNMFTKDETRECNVCGWHGKNFYPFFNEMSRKKDPTLCPVCKSSVYQRSLMKYLLENYEPSKRLNVLEVAPHSSNPVNKALPLANYISIDIVKGRAMEVGDLRKLIYQDNTFDLIVASAVLEHIKEDTLALKEIYRTLKVNGTAIIQIPMGFYGDPLGKHTTEFVGQPFYEHYRAYGYADFVDKATTIGFTVGNKIFEGDKLGFNSPSLMGFFVCTKEK